MDEEAQIAAAIALSLADVSSAQSSSTQASAGEGACRAGSHRFVKRFCMVCKGCGCCTGFGRACVNHRDGRTGGEVCGCGFGPSGCADCGLCESCARQGVSFPAVSGARTPKETPKEGEQHASPSSPSAAEVRRRRLERLGGGGLNAPDAVAEDEERRQRVQEQDDTAHSTECRTEDDVRDRADISAIVRAIGETMGEMRSPSVSGAGVNTGSQLSSDLRERSTAPLDATAAGMAGIIIEKHKVEWLRVAQLAVPDVAAATHPRFCDGGQDVEKKAVCDVLLSALKEAGFDLEQGIRRIWAGSRNIEEVAIAGEDADDKAILRHILSQIVESVADLRSDPAQKDQLDRLETAKARALKVEDRTWRCAARLATQGGSETSESSLFLAWVLENVESRGLLVAEGLSKILNGDRHADSVTSGADLCDSACLKKVLEYITAIEAGTESADGWPTIATLTGPNSTTLRFINAHQHWFEQIARATDDGVGGGSGTKAQLRGDLRKWEGCGWKLTRGVELMWRGERTEHTVLKGADPNSKHVLLAILQAFEAFPSSLPPRPKPDLEPIRSGVAAQTSNILLSPAGVDSPGRESPKLSPPGFFRQNSNYIPEYKVLLASSSSKRGSEHILRSLENERERIYDKFVSAYRTEEEADKRIHRRSIMTYTQFRDLLSANAERLQLDICHFCGHGENRSLVFEDGQGNEVDLSTGELVDELVRDRPGFCGIKSLVLNACCSGDIARAVAERNKNVVVVCWDSKAETGACETFTQKFYEYLLNRCRDADVCMAVEQAYKNVEQDKPEFLKPRPRGLNRLVISPKGKAGLWTWHFDSSSNEWRWREVKREARADDGMDEFPLPPLETTQSRTTDDACTTARPDGMDDTCIPLPEPEPEPEPEPGPGPGPGPGPQPKESAHKLPTDEDNMSWDRSVVPLACGIVLLLGASIDAMLRHSALRR